MAQIAHSKTPDTEKPTQQINEGRLKSEIEF